MASTHIEPVAAPRARRAPHVAVLDSNPAILDYIRRILADRYQLSLFSLPDDLIACIGQHPAPDLVLMDWITAENNTGVHSLGLLKKILDASPSLPVVMLSCSADLKEVVQATRLGAADIILKPFNSSEIGVGSQAPDLTGRAHFRRIPRDAPEREQLLRPLQ